MCVDLLRSGSAETVSYCWNRKSLKAAVVLFAFIGFAGCVHIESNPIPPSIDLSPEELELQPRNAPATGVVFGVDVRANESDTLVNIEILPGLKVFNVQPNSPADFAGISVNDVILSIDGIETNDLNTFKTIAMNASPDQQLKFIVRRGTTALEASVVPRAAKNAVPLKELYRVDPVASRAAFRTAIFTSQGGAKNSAAEVVKISADSPLHEADVAIGDVITAIDGHPVRSAQGLVSRLIENYEPGATRTLSVVSEGKNYQRTLALWDPGEYVARVQFWPLFRYETRPDPKLTVFQLLEILPIYRMEKSTFETHHRFLVFFGFSRSRQLPSDNAE